MYTTRDKITSLCCGKEFLIYTCLYLRVRFAASPPFFVQGPRTGAGGRKIKPYKSEKYRRHSAVQDRPETLRIVADKVGNRHLAREDESHRSREKPEEH
ncbi:MAG: hypothetical protein UY32_C0008G0016 [Candidatus Jorgensenbacteria bacterium GW2011_GWC1_48_8]|uniref:Uncharacterized protein n=1 Tax=Candidatus Jorgensenbacteria bacterium GW2011_GWC1_48_8 TaxID=1618666 RepID=A0A0G1XXK3_9BACT|nr:MAG: hypothetical protein UY32_C0008G0016 [Candidatus Jorgensenbacteria bacterium GW2011_GWC1_48_8]